MCLCLLGRKTNNPLTESPLVRYLNYGAWKDRYWTYLHMDLQIKNYIDCSQYLFPQYTYMFELDHSIGHNMERPEGLLTILSHIFHPDVPQYDVIKEDEDVTRKHYMILSQRLFPDTSEKGAAQITCKRGLINTDGMLPNGNKYTLSSTSVKDVLIKVILHLTPKCHPEIGAPILFSRCRGVK